ncbi:hypothetical protein J4206_00880 [Candidatus Woesearchaeota archaeon]|nr:hypothetical protein [Candidatus Woesearchaeota archaeon]
MIRWLCTKCNLKWIHPVDVCINCNSKIEKQISILADAKYTIAGFSEITVPSTLHPRVPYTVLLLKDKHGNLMPKKIMRRFTDADIGKEFVFEKGDVAIIKVKYDYYAAILNALLLLQDLDLISYKNKRILVHAELLDDKKETLEKKSQLQMVDAIKQIFEKDAGCIVDVNSKNADIAEYNLVIDVPFMRVNAQVISGKNSTLTLANAIFAPNKDEPTHLNMIIAARNFEDVNSIFDIITTGKGEFKCKIAGDELEANIRVTQENNTI